LRTFDLNCDLGESYPRLFTAGSACIHGDGPNTVAVAHAVRRAVTEPGREIATVGATA
jgi:lactam utilization protein B